MSIYNFDVDNDTNQTVLKYKNESEKRRREELIHIANHDPLTHLINRRRLWEHLRSCEEQKNRC